MLDPAEKFARSLAPDNGDSIDLAETPLADRGFTTVEELNHEVDWMRCEVKNQKWLGNGGPNMLRPILRAFLTWAKV